MAVVLQSSSATCTAAVTLMLGGRPTTDDLAWATLAGCGTGVGGCHLFRSLASGRTAVVAPLSAVGAALLPIVVGLATGKRPSLVALTAIALAVRSERLRSWPTPSPPAAAC